MSGSANSADMGGLLGWGFEKSLGLYGPQARGLDNMDNKGHHVTINVQGRKASQA